jgi:hypothetical protein
LYLGDSAIVKWWRCFGRFANRAWAYYGLIMANIKIFQLLPDMYDMLLGVTNSIVIVIYSYLHSPLNALTDARSSG